MKKIALLSTLLICAFAQIHAQNVGIGTNTPNASALLELSSINKGLLIPRMTFAQRNAIAGPVTGLLVYQTDNTPGLYHYNGAWTPLGGAGDNLGNHTLTTNVNTGTNYISRNGTGQGLQMLVNGGLSIRTKFITSGNNIREGEGFRFDSSGNILAVGFVQDVGNTTGAANKIPATGAGTRFMWFAARGSLRFGRAIGTEWDDANQDDFTFAGGNQVTASGYGAFAYGDQVNVSSTVGVGFGSGIKVTGTAGFSSGASNVTGGFCATTMGYTDSAMGQGSVALGYRVLARENYSLALGYRGRAIHEGSIILSDASVVSSNISTYTTSSADNQFTARYAGGYRLFTNSTMTVGVGLTAGDNSWNIISDSTKKERYLETDGDDLLKKLRNMRLGSWNYLGQRERRHYGPMAQEFNAAFGKDAYGKFGNDTTISQGDMAGVMMIMLKELENRTVDQANELTELKKQNEQLSASLENVRKINEEWNNLLQLLSSNEATKELPEKIKVLTKIKKETIAKN